MTVIEITDDNAENFEAFIDEDMIENLEREFFRGIGAMDDSGKPVGALVFELKDSESEADTKSRIRSLNVLNDEVKDLIMSEYEDAASNEAVVESFYELPDEEMSKRLEASGFSLEVMEGLDLVVTMEDIKKLVRTININKFPAYISSLGEVSVAQYRTFIKNCMFKGRYGLLEDLPYLTKNWFEQEVSCCALTDDDLSGVFLLKRTPSGALFALLYTAFGPDYQRNLGLMMAYTAKRIAEIYPDETRVVIRRHNEGVKKLTDRFFSNLRGEQVFNGKRSEA